MDQHAGDWYILSSGLPSISTSINLAPGVDLRPLKEPLEIFDLAAAGAVGFREWTVLESIAHACKNEIHTTREFDIQPGYNTLNRAWLVSSLLVIRGFTHHLGIACSTYSWNKIAGHQKRTSHQFKEQLSKEGLNAAVHTPRHDLPEFVGGLVDYHLDLIINDAARMDSITSDDAAWISKHFETFNRLAAESDSFRFALEAATDWRFAKDVRAAVARLWSGIEAVFSIRSELVFRISLIAASLLAQRGESRRNKFRETKKLYNLRSKVVHGAKISSNEAREALNGSFELLSDLLILSVESGHPLNQEDFDKAVFD